MSSLFRFLITLTAAVFASYWLDDNGNQLLAAGFFVVVAVSALSSLFHETEREKK